MPTPRGRLREPSQIGALAVVAAAATLLVVFAGGRHELKTERAAAAASRWVGLVGEGRPKVKVDTFSIVVLKAPSLAARVKAAGGTATEQQERRWTRDALNAQKQLLSRIGLQGVRISTEFSYTRVINGFSAALDPQAVGLLERAPEVRGVYPVRAAYPATVAAPAVRRAMRTAGLAAHPAGLTLPGFDGRGVTVALLDTGVDRFHPYLAGRVQPGRDIVSGAGPARAQPNPADSTDIERHGTELAGVLVGHGGSYGLKGIAPGATVVPLRVAGWQRDVAGDWAVYGRSDQLLAGLEAAVDPNGDGDTHDGARIALVGVAEPYVSFPDAPEARAVDGALALDTLVVAPAGNDLAAGPVFGSISGPGGARGALSVGAADLRRETERVHVAARVGLEIRLSERLPLAGAFAPSRRLDLRLAAPPSRHSTTTLADFFDDDGESIVAGRAALVAAGNSPGAAVENAARAGAYAILLYGDALPAGALGLDENVSVPVIALTQSRAESLRAALERGEQVTISIGGVDVARNAGGDRIAEFSSRGLAYDGRVKPDLIAPGVTIPTAEPGTNEDGTPRFGSVNGTSVAAAGAAGAAALLAQARPDLSASELLGLLVGTADPLVDYPLDAQGAGVVDVGGAAAAEVSAEPATLALPPIGLKGGRTIQQLAVRNVSTRRLRLVVGSTGGTEAFSIAPSPRRLVLRPGETAQLRLVGKSIARPSSPLAGAITIRPIGGKPIRVPWLATPRPPTSGLLPQVQLTPKTFDPAETSPVLSLRAGRLFLGRPRPRIQPISRLEIALRRNKGKQLGLLARLRDQLPGRYYFVITGRAPTGQILSPGRYELVIRAYPTTRGRPTRKSVDFRIER